MGMECKINDDPLNPHSALVYMMVLVSAADGNMTDSELRQMGEQVRNLPVFRVLMRKNLYLYQKNVPKN